MKYRWMRLKREIWNYLREKNASGLLSIVFLFRSLMLGVNSYRRLRALSAVLSHYPWFAFSPVVAYALKTAKHESVLSDDQSSTLNNCLIIKRYISPSEKGLILISFERELEKIVAAEILSKIEERFQIIFIPSWSGLFSPALFCLASRSSNDFFVLPVHPEERLLCNLLGPNCVALPFNAASWVNSSFFSQQLNRDIDCLMVANFADFKRHWLLFKALSRLSPSITAVCVGVPWGGRTAESLELEARSYGVDARVTIVENPSQGELRHYFQRAKVFCALSYREGSFIAVAESLIAGTPVLMFENAHIGTKELLNTANGRLVKSLSELCIGIRHFINTPRSTDVARRSKSNFSAEANCYKLNAELKKRSLSTEKCWKHDIYPFYSMRLEFFYRDESAKGELEDDYKFWTSLGIPLKGAFN